MRTRTARWIVAGMLATLPGKADNVFLPAKQVSNAFLKDAKLVDKKLMKEEIASIVAFLGALECKGVVAQP